MTIVVLIALGLWGLLMFVDNEAEKGHRNSMKNTRGFVDAVRGGCGWGLAKMAVGFLFFVSFWFILWLMWVN